MFPNAKASELVSILTAYAPASVSASTVVTSYVPVANHHHLMALLQTGVMGSSGTIDAKIVQATDSSGTSSKDVTGKAITQIVKASGDGKQAIINVRSSDLDVAGGFNHIALSITVGTAASLLSAAILGLSDRFAPASADNATTVAQVV